MKGKISEGAKAIKFYEELKRDANWVRDAMKGYRREWEEIAYCPENNFVDYEDKKLSGKEIKENKLAKISQSYDTFVKDAVRRYNRLNSIALGRNYLDSEHVQKNLDDMKKTVDFLNRNKVEELPENYLIELVSCPHDECADNIKG